jgi:type IV secretion system protein VirB3
MEPLETDTLYLAATRPAMFMGVPLPVGALLMMLSGLIVVVMKNPLYLGMMVPLWFAARELVSRDYNAVGVVLLYLRTAGRSVDSHLWGGASVSPFPIRIRKRGRGMADVW